MQDGHEKKASALDGTGTEAATSPQRPTLTLKDRLRQASAAEAAQAAALLEERLQSLRKASEEQLSAAEATMKRDTEAMTVSFTRSLSESLSRVRKNLRLIERLTYLSPLILMITILITLGLSSIILAHGLMTLSRWSEAETISRLGLSMIRQEGASIIVIPDPDMVQSCSLTPNRPLPCIVILEK